MDKNYSYNESKWSLLCDKAVSCKDCALHIDANRKVICDPLAYDGQKDILFIGEAPGDSEEEQGVPLADVDGRFLRDLIRGAMIPRSAYAITNVVMCRPPRDRDPEPSELQACKKWLVLKINTLKPKAIVTLGKHASQEMLGRSLSILNVSGRPKETNLSYGSVKITLPMMPLPHPRWGRSNRKKYDGFFAIMDRWLKSLGVDERDKTLI